MRCRVKGEWCSFIGDKLVQNSRPWLARMSWDSQKHHHCTAYKFLVFLSLSSIKLFTANHPYLLIFVSSPSQRLDYLCLWFRLSWWTVYYTSQAHVSQWQWSTQDFILEVYIGWQWRNFFISAVFRHFVGQALRNVCCSDVSRRYFLNKIAIVRTFS